MAKSKILYDLNLFELRREASKLGIITEGEKPKKEICLSKIALFLYKNNYDPDTFTFTTKRLPKTSPKSVLSNSIDGKTKERQSTKKKVGKNIKKTKNETFQPKSHENIQILPPGWHVLTHPVTGLPCGMINPEGKCLSLDDGSGKTKRSSDDQSLKLPRSGKAKKCDGLSRVKKSRKREKLNGLPKVKKSGKRKKRNRVLTSGKMKILDDAIPVVEDRLLQVRQSTKRKKVNWLPSASKSGKQKKLDEYPALSKLKKKRENIAASITGGSHDLFQNQENNHVSLQNQEKETKEKNDELSSYTNNSDLVSYSLNDQFIISGDNLTDNDINETMKDIDNLIILHKKSSEKYNLLKIEMPIIKTEDMVFNIKTESKKISNNFTNIETKVENQIKDIQSNNASNETEIKDTIESKDRINEYESEDIYIENKKDNETESEIENIICETNNDIVFVENQDTIKDAFIKIESNDIISVNENKVAISDTINEKNTFHTKNPNNTKGTCIREKSFQCDICGKNFLQYKQLNSHKRIHTGENSYKCKFCEKEFRRSRSLTEHRQAVHSVGKKFKHILTNAESCKRWRLKNEEKVREHNKKRVEGRQELEKKDPTAAKQQRNYRAKKRKEQRLKKKWQDSEQLKVWIKDSSPERIVDGKKVKYICVSQENVVNGPPYNCIDCSYKSNSIMNVNKHFRKHSKEKPFGCKDCSKKYSTSLAVSYHWNNIHNKKKEFTCDVCGSMFAFERILKKHLAFMHSNESFSLCSVCGKSFKNLWLRNQHEARHNQERVACPVCGKMLSNLYMKNHIERHDEGKSIPCDICGNKFKTNEDVRNHKRVHTNLNLKCAQCGNLFKKEIILKYHIKRVHEKATQFQCPLCPLILSHKDRLRRHSTRRHNGQMLPFS